MLYLLFFMTTLFIVVAATVRTGKRYNPLNFYIVFWGICSIVSLTNPFGLYDVSTRTYLIVWLNSTVFSIAYLLFYRNRKEAIRSDKLVNNKMLGTKKVLFIQLFVFVVLLFFYRRYSSLLDSLGLIDARRIVYDQGYLFNSSYELIFFTWVITPILYVSVLLLLSDFVMNGVKRLALYVSLINCVLFGLIGYGRFIHFQIIVYAIVAIGFKYDIHKKVILNTVKMKKRTKLLLTLLIFTAVYFMNISSAKRLGRPIHGIKDHYDMLVNVSLNQLITYFTGPFRALDNFINSNIIESTGHTYGRSFFGGLEEIVNTFVSFLGQSWTTANTVSNSFTANNILIGNAQSFNAFYSSIMNHYLDGGIIFVAISAFFFGFLSVTAYNYYLKSPNLITLSLNLFLTYHMIASEFRWSFTTPSIWITFGILIWVNKRYNSKIKIIEAKETSPRFVNKHSFSLSK